VTLRAEDLRGDAADAYRMWRDVFGLSEQSAMHAMEQDGLITLTEDEKFARSFQETWGLSRAAAEVAARGRNGGSSSRPASEARSLASLRPNPSNIQYVVAAIEEIASGLRRQGVTQDEAVRDAAIKVMLKVPDDRTADWVARIATRFWPRIYGKPESSGTAHR
jgi:hypothetical protein